MNSITDAQERFLRLHVEHLHVRGGFDCWRTAGRLATPERLASERPVGRDFESDGYPLAVELAGLSRWHPAGFGPPGSPPLAGLAPPGSRWPTHTRFAAIQRREIDRQALGRQVRDEPEDLRHGVLLRDVRGAGRGAGGRRGSQINRRTHEFPGPTSTKTRTPSR